MHCPHKFAQIPHSPEGAGQLHMGPMDKYIRGSSSKTDHTSRAPPASSAFSSSSLPEGVPSTQSANWNPAFSTTSAIRPLAGEPCSRKTTVMRPVSKFNSTLSTPCNSPTARSTLAAQPAQCMPETR